MNKLADYRKFGKVSATRYNDGDVAIYAQKFGHNDWRLLVDQDGICAPSGERAATKFELFTCILPTVAKNWGFN